MLLGFSLLVGAGILWTVDIGSSPQKQSPSSLYQTNYMLKRCTSLPRQQGIGNNSHLVSVIFFRQDLLWAAALQDRCLDTSTSFGPLQFCTNKLADPETASCTAQGTAVNHVVAAGTEICTWKTLVDKSWWAQSHPPTIAVDSHKSRS